MFSAKFKKDSVFIVLFHYVSLSMGQLNSFFLSLLFGYLKNKKMIFQKFLFLFCNTQIIYIYIYTQNKTLTRIMGKVNHCIPSQFAKL